MKPGAIDPQRLEALHLLSTAPREQLEYDGWLLRRAPNDVKRARSVNTVSPSKLPLDEKIEYVERLYEDAGLPSLFRLTPFSTPPELDAVLAQGGYERIDPSLQQLASLATVPLSPGVSLNFKTLPLEAWQAVAGPMRGQALAARTAEYRRLSQRELPVTCVLGHARNEPVACGLVLQIGAFATLMDIYVVEARRGQGYGTAITVDILSRARDNGAEIAWLNVLADNDPAQRTYARLGFETLYEYWYRVGPQTDPSNR